jgi:hypothetical protein
MINHATEHGRNSLSGHVLGTIFGNLHNLNCEKIVAEAKEIREAYYEVFLDNSLPWHAPDMEKTSATTEATEKFTQLNLITDIAPMEEVSSQYTIDDMIRREA